MPFQKRLLPALLLSLFAGAAATAAPAARAAQFSNVVVFGDSLSDAGYYRPFLASLGLPPQLVATLGRFTTNPGPIWAELVSEFYGVTPAPSNAGGSIYAQGGARVAQPSASTPPDRAQRPVSTQIDEYLAANGGHADPNALYTVWIGANDIFQNLAALQAGAIDASTLQANVLGAATVEVGQVARLRAAGARYVAVFGLPNIGGTLAFVGSSSSAAVTQLSAGYNTTLFSGLAAAGIRAIPVDQFTFFNEVAGNPAAYGITNVTSFACGPFPPITTASTVSSQFCGPTNLVAPDAAQTYLFADSVHPTTAAHALIAQFTESLIEGPTQYSLLAETPLATRAAHVRTLNDGLLMAREAPVGKFKVFASGSGGKYDVDSGTGLSGVNNDLSAFSVGVTMRASEAFVLGAAFGQDRADGDFGGGAGSFRTRENVFSLFGALRSGGFYGTGVFSVSNIDFKDMHRNIVLGPAVRTATASTDGSNGSGYLSAGYDFQLGHLAIGPTASVTWQNVTVNAFDESGAGAASLHIAEQSRHSEVWSGGVRASYALENWTPWLRVTADRERRNDARFVTAMPLSLAATGNSYDIAAYAPDRDSVTTSVGINGILAQRFGLSLAYYNVSNRSGIKEDGISGVVSYRF
ncbi:MAG TPA: autotransporter domain-containing protein [Usitatibacter sp.]|nr:autotransporter domain-containing protein [Usitatibacter sp.]